MQLDSLSLTNVWLACTNVVGIYAACQYTAGSRAWCGILLATAASFLMHISETKHGLPGFWLAQYSGILLWLDRMVAIGTGICTLPYLTRRLALYGAVGLLLSAAGEMRVTRLREFIVLHSAWHVIAFGILSVVWKQ